VLIPNPLFSSLSPNRGHRPPPPGPKKRSARKLPFPFVVARGSFFFFPLLNKVEEFKGPSGLGSKTMTSGGRLLLLFFFFLAILVSLPFPSPNETPTWHKILVSLSRVFAIHPPRVPPACGKSPEEKLVIPGSTALFSSRFMVNKRRPSLPSPRAGHVTERPLFFPFLDRFGVHVPFLSSKIAPFLFANSGCPFFFEWVPLKRLDPILFFLPQLVGAPSFQVNRWFGDPIRVLFFFFAAFPAGPFWGLFFFSR